MIACISNLLGQCFNIALPFGLTLGTLCVFCWSIPMLIKFIKSIF